MEWNNLKWKLECCEVEQSEVVCLGTETVVVEWNSLKWNIVESNSLKWSIVEWNSPK